MSNESPERTSREGVLLGSNVAYKYDNGWYLDLCVHVGVVVKYRYRGGVIPMSTTAAFGLNSNQPCHHPLHFGMLPEHLQLLQNKHVLWVHLRETKEAKKTSQIKSARVALCVDSLD